jgi:hypothetical protein
VLDLSEYKVKDRVSPNDCDSWPRDWDKHMNKVVETRLYALVKVWVNKLKDSRRRSTNLIGGIEGVYETQYILTI